MWFSPSTAWQISSATQVIKAVLGLSFDLSVFATYSSEASIRICLNEGRTHGLLLMLVNGRNKICPTFPLNKSERYFPRSRDANVALCPVFLSTFNLHVVAKMSDIISNNVASLISVYVGSEYLFHHSRDGDSRNLTVQLLLGIARGT